MNLKSKFYSLVLATVFTLSLCTCQTPHTKESSLQKLEARWYNTHGFPGIESIGVTPHDLEFDIAFSKVDGDTVQVKNCLEVAYLGQDKIVESEFARWELLKADCEAANRFYAAPEVAINYWPTTFDFPLVKSFPATAVPYLGGQSLDGRTGNLGEHEPKLTLLESNDHSVKISVEDMVVNYVVVAKADFNRDGYQDIFVRLDWYIESSFGDGFDWVVLTKTSSDTTPLMLWRK